MSCINCCAFVTGDSRSVSSVSIATTNRLGAAFSIGETGVPSSWSKRYDGVVVDVVRKFIDRLAETKQPPHSWVHLYFFVSSSVCHSGDERPSNQVRYEYRSSSAVGSRWTDSRFTSSRSRRQTTVVATKSKLLLRPVPQRCNRCCRSTVVGLCVSPDRKRPAVAQRANFLPSLFDLVYRLCYLSRLSVCVCRRLTLCPTLGRRNL